VDGDQDVALPDERTDVWVLPWWTTTVAIVPVSLTAIASNASASTGAPNTTSVSVSHCSSSLQMMFGIDWPSAPGLNAALKSTLDEVLPAHEKVAWGAYCVVTLCCQAARRN